MIVIETSYLRSVDFKRNIVALRCPFGGVSHFKASADQINTELTLKVIFCIQNYITHTHTNLMCLKFPQDIT